MNLHRTTGLPDWEGLEGSQLNPWQRLAKKTSGIMTPSNLITAMGLLLVIAGVIAIANSQLWLGVIGLIAGRLLDVADGWAADVTATKSPLGESIDASADKIGTIATVIVLGISGTVAWWLVLALALPQIIITLMVVSARRHGRRLHPSRLGKLSMAAAWISLLGLIVLRASGQQTGSIAGILAYSLVLVALVMGICAAVGYARSAD